MSTNTHVAENLKATIEKAERYVLVALSSASVFAVLSFAKVKGGDVVRWELLGFPLDFSPPLALVVLYFLYFFSCLLADNMLLHIRDLAAKLDDKNQVSDILGYPSILTVSPIASFLGTVAPAALVIVGLAKTHAQGVYPLHYVVWCFAYGFGLSGLLVYLRVYKIIVPHLGDWLKSSKKAGRNSGK